MLRKEGAADGGRTAIQDNCVRPRCAVRATAQAIPSSAPREAIERLDAGAAVVDVARTFGVDRAPLYRIRAEAAQ